MEQYEIIDKLRSAGGLSYAEVCRDKQPFTAVYLSRIIAQQKTVAPETFRVIVKALCNARKARVNAQWKVIETYEHVCELKRRPPIKRVREAAGLTQRALASEHGVTFQRIQHLEAPETEFDQDAYDRLRQSIDIAYQRQIMRWGREDDQWEDVWEEVTQDGELK